ncbi:MAG: FAD-dependent oxidoreductase [Actinobacteria bacterium]|nr:FAD-dependent oxidoreductase [Actinomycetota bacterium]
MRDKKNMGNGRVVIIGGIAAGTSAAAKCRRQDEDLEIIIYEKDKYISYGTCGLPYFVSGKIANMNKLLINTPGLFSKRFNIDVRTENEVLSIDAKNKKILIRDLKNNKEFEDHYDKLILTTGSIPIKIKMEGYGARNIFVLKTLKDALDIKKYLENIKNTGKEDKNAVIIGGGFIGLELLEAYLEGGFKVSIIEKDSQILPMFDREIIEYLENYLESLGIRIFKNEEAKKLINRDDNTVIKVLTSGGESLDADMVFFGIGTKPNNMLAAGAGIKIAKSGAIAVDEFMQTSIDDIYAAGDCCECENLISGDRRSYNLATIANRQGRTAGYNAAGGSERFDGSIVTSIIKVLDIAIGKTGLSLKEAKRLGIDAGCIEVHYGSHAGYYPGAETMHMLVVFDKKSRKLIGLEAIGRDGIDKRIDIASAAIKGGLGIEDLASIEMAYQPAFGSARDSINILGMIAENIQKEEVGFVDIPEMREKIKNGDDMIILDVRSAKEYDAGHIEGAILIPVDDIRSNINMLDPGKETIIYCRSGYRAYLALRVLANHGFSDVKLLNGSYLSWERKL